MDKPQATPIRVALNRVRRCPGQIQNEADHQEEDYPAMCNTTYPVCAEEQGTLMTLSQNQKVALRRKQVSPLQQIRVMPELQTHGEAAYVHGSTGRGRPEDRAGRCNDR